jgi:hypothetical protein
LRLERLTHKLQPKIGNSPECPVGFALLRAGQAPPGHQDRNPLTSRSRQAVPCAILLTCRACVVSVMHGRQRQMPDPVSARCWRPRPELNRGTRFCRPLRNHSATWPFASIYMRLVVHGNIILPGPPGGGVRQARGPAHRSIRRSAAATWRLAARAQQPSGPANAPFAEWRKNGVS